uniref:Uncharacterized protein n=1 Tax=Lepeophtheirus salmonis TaxID=72036 RepID=A0A0K2TXH7_LEPSM
MLKLTQTSWPFFYYSE